MSAIWIVLITLAGVAVIGFVAWKLWPWFRSF